MKKILFLLFIVLSFSACQTEEPIDTITNTTPIINLPTSPVEGSVSGLVTDVNGPLAQVQVQLMGQTIETDDQGLFSFNDIELDREGTLVKATATSYINGSRVFYPSADNNNFVHIRMQLPFIDDFSSANGGLVQIQEASILLPSGDYVTAVDRYSGSITTKGLWLDPTKEDFYQSMPGDLRGINEEDELVSLVPFGMIKLSLENNLSQELDLPLGTTAELNMPIPTALLNAAPQTIPLYYYEAENGVWIQEGFAEKEDGFYKGEVNHFTFWTCASSHEIINLSGQILIDGQVAANTLISLNDTAQGFSITLSTSDSGHFMIRVPSGLDLTLSTQGDCNGEMLESPLGVLTEEKECIIDFENAESADINISGYIMNCDNTAPATNAFARIVFDQYNLLVKVNEDGFFEKKIDACTDAITIYGIDMENDKVSDSQVFLASPEVIVDFILPCDSVSSGFNIDYEGMDWKSQLQNTVIHDWKISDIILTGGPRTIIFSPSITNAEDASQVYMSGAFVFKEGDTEVTYLLDFKTQGFKVEGSFEVIAIPHDSFTSYRFVGTSTDITELDGDLYPGNIEEVFIDLVYYD